MDSTSFSIKVMIVQGDLHIEITQKYVIEHQNSEQALL